MRHFLGWFLLLATLFAQSAWAFEGHAGHFDGDDSHQHAPAKQGDGGDKHSPATASHCAHSPVHFVAVHRDPVTVAAGQADCELPPYRAPVSSLYAEPPTQPPRG